MRHLMELKRMRKERLSGHPFYGWVRSDEVPLEERLLFAPIMAVFVMNFRDANKWFIRFPDPKSHFEEIINGNTREDETHSMLFLENWRALGLDDKLAFRASDALWWLFLADETEPFRSHVMEFARMTVEDGGDPLIRFAHSEAGEACGNAFFAAVAPIADELEKKTNQKHRYFSSHHLDREPGHVLESPGVFETQELSPPARERALRLATRMFDIFDEIHDDFLKYAKTYVAKGKAPRRPERKPSPKSTSNAGKSECPHTIAPGHDAVRKAIETRKKQAAAHPFYAWLREETGLDEKEKLRRFIPYWIVDIMGYRDLNRYAIRYSEPQNPLAASINRWCDDLETHSALFLDDWAALGMDARLGWSASETMRFCFLDKRVDVHRKNMATFVKLAMRHERPTLRLWLLEALEASGHAFFENTKKLALAVEAAEGIRLDYLADRHDAAHAPAPRRAEDRALLLAEPISPEDRDIAIGMVEAVFDALDEQLALSLEAARTNALGIS